MIDFETYAKWVYKDAAKPHRAMANSDYDKYMLGAVGLAGEASEVMELAYHLRYFNIPIARESMLNELGDVLWYFALLTECLGADVTDRIASIRYSYNSGVPVINGDIVGKVAMSMCVSSGRVLEMCKKHLFHGKSFPDYLMIDNLITVYACLVRMADIFGITLEEIIEANVEKLVARNGHIDPRTALWPDHDLTEETCSGVV